MFRLLNDHISKWKLLLFLGDGVCFAISVIVALRLNPYTSNHPWEYLQEVAYPIVIIGLVYCLVLYIGDVYDFQQDYRQVMNFGRVLISCWAGGLAAALIVYFPYKSDFIGRTLLIILTASFSMLVALWRFTFSTIALPQRLEKKLIIIGAGKSGRDLLGALREIPGNGFMPVGFVDDDGKKIGTAVDGLPVMGNSSELSALIQKNQVSLLVLAVMNQKSPALVKNLIQLSWSDCQLMDMPTLYEILTKKLPTEHISEEFIFEWNINTSKIYYLRLKRFIDLILSSIFLIITLPIMVLTLIVIKFDSKGPILFTQDRLGLKGKAFQIMKFRTMIQGAENNGPVWTDHNDPRITRVGKVVRKLRLDELPQLWNIVRGEMSFIGPRPLAHTGYMDNIDFYKYRTLVKPGITGWAQVTYPEGLSIDTTQEKLKYDLYYIKNIGLLLDLAILLKTVRIVIFGHGR
jgi:exopolysaccharide biosynthesis polyprenyl glycosylphosphotransferase